MGGLRDALAAGFKGAAGVVSANIEAEIQTKRDNAVALFRHNLGKDERAAKTATEQSRYDEGKEAASNNLAYDRDQASFGEFKDRIATLADRKNELQDNFAADYAGLGPDDESYVAAKASLDLQVGELSNSLRDLYQSNPKYASRFGKDPSSYNFADQDEADDADTAQQSLDESYDSDVKQESLLKKAQGESFNFEQQWKQFEKAENLEASGSLRELDKTTAAQMAPQMMDHLRAMARDSTPGARSEVQSMFNRVRKFADSTKSPVKPQSDREYEAYEMLL